MRINFYEPDQSYHTARYNFVYKVAPSQTPVHLAKHRHVGQNSDECAVIVPEQKVVQTSLLMFLRSVGKLKR